MFEGKLARLAGLRESWSCLRESWKVENSRSSGLSLCLIDKLVTLRWCFSFVLNEGERGEKMEMLVLFIGCMLQLFLLNSL